MARTGKIARLPQVLRSELNRRLRDGGNGATLVEWLNALPEVKEVLEADFAGRPLNEQNLSEWRQGGFREWQRHQDSCDLVRGLVERSDDLDDEADQLEISHRLSSVLAAELSCVAEALLDQAGDPGERWDRLREILPELLRLRRADHKTDRLRMDRERWDMEYQDLRDEQLEREVAAGLHRNSMAKVLGTGESGKKFAAALPELQHDLKPGTPSKSNTADPPGPESADTNQGKSNLIKPNQGKK
jgi:hypothetical protein